MSANELIKAARSVLGDTGDSLTAAMDRLHHEKHAQYRRWQDAVEMNMVFGDDYVTTPPVPKGYEKLAQQWRDNLNPVR